MKEILLYIWQLPQNLLGLLLLAFYKGNDKDDKGLVIVRRSLKMQGGISLSADMSSSISSQGTRPYITR